MGRDFWTILFYIHRSYNNHLHISSSETTMLLHCHAHVLSILLVTWSSFLGVLSKLFTFQNSFVCGFFWSNLSPLLSFSLTSSLLPCSSDPHLMFPVWLLPSICCGPVNPSLCLCLCSLALICTPSPIYSSSAFIKQVCQKALYTETQIQIKEKR